MDVRRNYVMWAGIGLAAAGGITSLVCLEFALGAPYRGHSSPEWIGYALEIGVFAGAALVVAGFALVVGWKPKT